MIVEEIETATKQMHQLAEEFNTACKAGDGFQAYYVLGTLYSLVPSLRAMGKKCHEMNQPEITKLRSDEWLQE